MQLEGITNYMMKSLTCAHGGGVGGVGERRAAERNRTAKEKQSKVQKINPRSEPGEAEQNRKIMTKNAKNHSQK